jgi:hypothetical protein
VGLSAVAQNQTVVLRPATIFLPIVILNLFKHKMGKKYFRLSVAASGQKNKIQSKSKKSLFENYAVKHPNSYIKTLEVSLLLTEKEDLQKLKSIYNKLNPLLKN